MPKAKVNLDNQFAIRCAIRRSEEKLSTATINTTVRNEATEFLKQLKETFDKEPNIYIFNQLNKAFFSLLDGKKIQLSIPTAAKNSRPFSSLYSQISALASTQDYFPPPLPNELVHDFTEIELTNPEKAFLPSQISSDAGDTEPTDDLANDIPRTKLFFGIKFSSEIKLKEPNDSKPLLIRHHLCFAQWLSNTIFPKESRKEQYTQGDNFLAAFLFSRAFESWLKGPVTLENIERFMASPELANATEKFRLIHRLVGYTSGEINYISKEQPLMLQTSVVAACLQTGIHDQIMHESFVLGTLESMFSKDLCVSRQPETSPFLFSQFDTHFEQLKSAHPTAFKLSLLKIFSQSFNDFMEVHPLADQTINDSGLALEKRTEQFSLWCQSPKVRLEIIPQAFETAVSNSQTLEQESAAIEEWQSMAITNHIQWNTPEMETEKKEIEKTEGQSDELSSAAIWFKDYFSTPVGKGLTRSLRDYDSRKKYFQLVYLIFKKYSQEQASQLCDAVLSLLNGVYLYTQEAITKLLKTNVELTPVKATFFVDCFLKPQYENLNPNRMKNFAEAYASSALTHQATLSSLNPKQIKTFRFNLLLELVKLYQSQHPKEVQLPEKDQPIEKESILSWLNQCSLAKLPHIFASALQTTTDTTDTTKTDEGGGGGSK